MHLTSFTVMVQKETMLDEQQQTRMLLQRLSRMFPFETRMPARRSHRSAIGIRFLLLSRHLRRSVQWWHWQTGLNHRNHWNSSTRLRQLSASTSLPSRAALSFPCGLLLLLAYSEIEILVRWAWAMAVCSVPCWLEGNWLNAILKSCAYSGKWNLVKISNERLVDYLRPSLIPLN